MKKFMMTTLIFLVGCSSTTHLKISADKVVSPVFVAQKVEIEFEANIKELRAKVGQIY